MLAFIAKETFETKLFLAYVFVDIFAPHVDLAYSFGTHWNQKGAESEPTGDQNASKHRFGPQDAAAP